MVKATLLTRYLDEKIDTDANTQYSHDGNRLLKTKACHTPTVLLLTTSNIDLKSQKYYQSVIMLIFLQFEHK